MIVSICISSVRIKSISVAITHPLSDAAEQCRRRGRCRSTLHPRRPRTPSPAWPAAPRPTATNPFETWPHTGPAGHK